VKPREQAAEPAGIFDLRDIVSFQVQIVEPGRDRRGCPFLLVGIELIFRPQVPTLVPNLGSPTITQEHLSGRKSAAIRALGLSWVMLDCGICSLKNRGRRRAQLSSEVWCEIPRVGGPIPLLATNFSTNLTRKATELELFCDLVFVVAIAKAVHISVIDLAISTC